MIPLHMLLYSSSKPAPSLISDTINIHFSHSIRGVKQDRIMNGVVNILNVIAPLSDFRIDHTRIDSRQCRNTKLIVTTQQQRQTRNNN